MVNTKTGAMQRVAPDEESNSGFVAVTPDGMRVFDADIDGVRAFDVASGNQVALIPAGAVNFAFGTKTNTLYANDVNQVSAINPTTNTIMHFDL